MVHVEFQLPNDHMRVGYILEAIEYDDADLLVAITKVEEDDVPSSKRKLFEFYATHLLSKDPVVKNLLYTKHTSGQISGVDGGAGARDGTGATWVHFRYHPPEKFGNLTQVHREELQSHRANHGGGQGGGGGGSGRGGAGGCSSKKIKGRGGRGCGRSAGHTGRGRGSGGQKVPATTVWSTTATLAETPAAVEV